MSLNRTISRAIARTSASCTLRSSVVRYTTAARIAPARPKATARAFTPRIPLQRRWISSTENPETEIYDFEKIKSIVTQPDDRTMLIDVREPHEYAEGFIPTALNVPIQSQPDALFLSPEEFEDRFGFAKPSTDKHVVFYCKAGVRSRAAAQLARQNGYEEVGEYPGSWMDWVKKGGIS